MAACGAGHGKPLFDSGLPRIMAERTHRALGSQYGNAAFNAQSGVEGLVRQLRASRHADKYRQPGAALEGSGIFLLLRLQGVSYLLARHRVDGSLANGHRQARQGDAPHPRPSLYNDVVGVCNCRVG